MTSALLPPRSRVLVTGGAGFIGSHLVEWLVDNGHDVVVLDDFSTGHHANISSWRDRLTLIEGSITDPGTCEEAVRGVRYVLHEAALPSVPRSVSDPIGSHATNATGTLNMLVAARDAGVQRFVYASSSSIYGDTPELPKCETMVPRPRSPYAVAKLAAEQYCAAFRSSYGLETVAMRYFNVFGPRQDPTSQYSGVVARFLACALSGERPMIYGDGEQTRDFTYVANVVDANIRACTAPAAVGALCNIGFGSRVSLNELWRHVQAITGATQSPTYGPVRAGDVRDSLASLERARELLGYEPVIGLDEGLARTAEFVGAVKPA